MQEAPGPLELKITDASGISLNDFVANADGYFFAADVIGPSGGTGAIAADKITATVPEPPSLALFAGLLFGAWFSISFATGRLRRLSGAFRQAQS